MRKIDTQIVIAAPPQRVWAVLTDFPRYPEWNPFIRTIHGKPQAGATLTVQMQPPGAKAVTFLADVIKAEPDRELRWLGSLWAPFLFAGEHTFQLNSLAADQTLLNHSERFTGILVPVLWPTIGDSTRRGFELMNQALQREAEKG